MVTRKLSVVFLAFCLYPTPSKGQNSSRYVKAVVPLRSGDSRVYWAKTRNMILYDAISPNNYFDIYVMNPDGTGQRCVTCNSPSLPNKHIGNPESDPTDSWIIFQAQKPDTVPGVPDFLANPGAGRDNDIWIMDWNAQIFLKVTNVPLSDGGVLHPHFSNKGNQITWAQRYSSSGSPYGLWTIQVADFSVQNGMPVVSNIQSFSPGAQKQFYETHAFSPDDSKILFSGNLTPGMSVYDIDIYTLDLQTGELVDLTNSNDAWDEHAHYTPSGNGIVWMSSMGNPPPTSGSVMSDYWIMNADGTDKIRLTYFNNPSSPEYISGVNQVTAADCAWNADGTALVASLITNAATYGGELIVINYDWSTVSVSSTDYLSKVAPSAITSAFSRGLSIGTTVASTAELPTSLNGTQLTVTDNLGVARAAQLYFVSPDLVNYVVPDGTVVGPATVTVTLNGMVVSTATAQISNIAPGFYTANQAGTGVPSAYFQIVTAGGPQIVQNAYQCDANGQNCVPMPVNLAAGQVFLSLFGTGLRHVAPGSVTATVGGVPVPVIYASSQPTYAGFDQVVLRIPPSLAGVSSADVVVSFNGTPGNTVVVGFQ
jgi:uncharacterized protein (TIGR03437 family)